MGNKSSSVQDVCKSLKVEPEATHVSFSEPLKVKEIHELCDTLKDNLHVLFLTLENVGLDDVSFSMLHFALRANKRLEVLNIGRNNLSNQSAELLLELLTVNTTLREIDLSETRISNEHKANIRAQLIRNHPECIPMSVHEGAKPIRILSLDGGGMRGLIELQILLEIERRTKRQIHELFDLICGTSTGGLIALALANPNRRKRLLEIQNMYMDLGRKIFGYKFGDFTAGTVKKLHGEGYYSTALLEKLLIEHLGDEPLFNSNPHHSPKVFVVAARCQIVPAQLCILSSYPCDGFYSNPLSFQVNRSVKMWEAARATSAAPTYFRGFELGPNKEIVSDGGMLQNNPTEIALVEARNIWPNRPIGCVVSVGTGKQPPTHSTDKLQKPLKVITKLMEVALNNSEPVHERVSLRAIDCPTMNYSRFNPPLLGKYPLDVSKSEQLDDMRKKTEIYIQSQDQKLGSLCSYLNPIVSSARNSGDPGTDAQPSLAPQRNSDASDKPRTRSRSRGAITLAVSPIQENCHPIVDIDLRKSMSNIKMPRRAECDITV